MTFLNNSVIIYTQIGYLLYQLMIAPNGLMMIK